MNTPQNSSNNAAQVTATISGKDLHSVFNRSKEQEPEFKDYFRERWESVLTSYYELSNLLDDIEAHSDELNEALEGIGNIDNWFNAYLCSDEFAQETPERKQRIIKSKEAVSWLLSRIEWFTRENGIGIYSKEN